MKSQHFTHMKEFPSELKAKEDIFFQYKKLELYIEEDTLSFCRSKLNFDWWVSLLMRRQIARISGELLYFF